MLSKFVIFATLLTFASAEMLTLLGSYSPEECRQTIRNCDDYVRANGLAIMSNLCFTTETSISSSCGRFNASDVAAVRYDNNMSVPMIAQMRDVLSEKEA